jgi:hypothetical protein
MDASQQREERIRKQLLAEWDVAIAREIARTDAEAARRAKRTHPIKAGELFILTQGQYSDFCVVDLFRALADFDLVPLRDAGDVAAQLVKQSLAEPVDHQEINLYDLD